MVFLCKLSWFDLTRLAILNKNCVLANELLISSKHSLFFWLIKQRNRLFVPIVYIIVLLLWFVGEMFEVQLVGNEFIMISTDKRFASGSFPAQRSLGFWLAPGKSKTKRANYPRWTCVISGMKVQKGDWRFRNECFQCKQASLSCLVSLDVLWRVYDHRKVGLMKMSSGKPF